MIVLGLDEISRYLTYFGVNMSYEFLTPFEQSILLILGNILWFIVCYVIFSVMYKILSRVINAIF